MMDHVTDDKPIRPRQNAVIFCPTCRVLCKANHTGKEVTYFYCPKCDYSKHVPRPPLIIPVVE